MSTTSNEYFMFGICLPFNWLTEWREKTGKMFYLTIEDIKLNDIFTADNNERYRIHTVFNSRGGKYIIIGRVLDRIVNNSEEDSNNGLMIQIPELKALPKIR